jgi:hypothetical protein
MNVLKPLRAALFFYETLRLLLLMVFLFITPVENNNVFFPYLVYLSANALFPMMALFVWLKPEEYRAYLNLYAAGKIIGMVSFFAWEIFSPRNFPGIENIVKGLILLGGSVFISLADTLTIWGAWTLKKQTDIGKH